MRQFMALVIIAGGFALALFLNAKLGDPSQPAGSGASSIFVSLPNALDNSAEERAIIARATADAVKELRIQATESERDRLYQLANERTRAAMEATAVIQETERAFERQLSEQKATADAEIRSTESARAAIESDRRSTEDQRIADLNFQKEAAIATATADAMRIKIQREELDLQSKALMNQIWAITSWAIPVFLLIIAAGLTYRFIWKKTELQIIQPAANGDKPLIFKGNTMIDPDLISHAVNNLKAPAPPASETQLAIKEADQKLDLARSLPKYAPHVDKSVSLEPVFQIIDPNGTPPAGILPNPDTENIINGDWNNQ